MSKLVILFETNKEVFTDSSLETGLYYVTTNKMYVNSGSSMYFCIRKAKFKKNREIQIASIYDLHLFECFIVKPIIVLC